MASLPYFAPLLSLSAFSFLALALDAALPQTTARSQSIGFWIGLLGVAVTGYLIPAAHPAVPIIFGHALLIWDGLAYFLSWLAILTVFVVILLSSGFREFATARLNAYFGLLFLAASGLILIAMANDFLLIFLAVELIGVPSFILVGFLRQHQRSNEAALKFFLIGAFSSAMLAYGLSILYGLAGTTSLIALRDHTQFVTAHAALTFLAIFFIVVSFGFKIALVPFHMWVPDALEGAPTPIAAFISVAPKIAGAAVALRVFQLSFPLTQPATLEIFAVLAALTMTVANVAGLKQTNVIRLLAYSSIAHMGYLMLGFIAGSPMGVSSMFLYAWAYLAMNLGAFTIATCIFNATGSQDLSAYAGLAKRAPVLSGLMTLFLVSLAGVPPTAGFISKFYVLASAYEGGHLWLVVLAMVNTVISVAYYFKILRAMYFKEATHASPIELTIASRVAVAITSFFTLCIGLGPQYFVNKADFLARPVLAVPSAPMIAQLDPRAGQVTSSEPSAAHVQETVHEPPTVH